MQKRCRFALMLLCALCLILSLGCGGKKAVSFSDVTVKTEASVGPFGGKYIVIEVKGSVTNNTREALSEDGVPVISWDGGKIEPVLTQNELKPKETCDVSWETHLDVEGTSIPELSFTGDIGFEGLDDAQTQLNEQLQAIAEKYVAEETARKEIEDALNACKGKPATEANDVAKGLGFGVKFKDSFDVDVTGGVTSGSDAGAQAATVDTVTINHDNKFVTFGLAYEDPAAKAEREKKAAEEAAKKKEAEEAEEKKKQALADLENCAGKTAAEVLYLLELTGYNYTVKDSLGEDVTKDFGNDLFAKSRERITIAEATLNSNVGEVELTLSSPLAVRPEESETFKAVFEHGESDSALLKDFVNAFDGVNIEFDGNIAALNNHEGKKTRYDLLILGSDYGASYGGVSFQFRDEAPTSFKWNGTQPDSVSVGMNLHIIAEVYKYEESSGLLIIKPVVLSVR